MAVAVGSSGIVKEYSNMLKLGEFHLEALVLMYGGTVYSPVNVTGSGYFLHFGGSIEYLTPDRRFKVELIIDGSTVLTFNYDKGGFVGGRASPIMEAPFQLIRSFQDGAVCINAGIPVRFESSLEIRFTNTSTGNHNIDSFQANWRIG